MAAAYVRAAAAAGRLPREYELIVAQGLGSSPTAEWGRRERRVTVIPRVDVVSKEPSQLLPALDHWASPVARAPT